MVKVLVVLGTRPEAIKLCPLILHLRTQPACFDVKVCVTGQHRSIMDGILARFGVVPDYDLHVMMPNQPLGTLTARILDGILPVLRDQRPDCVLVQGDTTTTFTSALAAFYERIPVGHVEAGLRTGNLAHPFPEELNRVLTTHLSILHFPPTERARRNLRAAGVPDHRIVVTGNTGIDALMYTRDKLERGEWRGCQWKGARTWKRLILLTAHRRENFGTGLLAICNAAQRIAARGDVTIVYPMHPNPNVRAVVKDRLMNVPDVKLVEPLDYVEFIDVMRRATLILTDSGGIQEEAPSLGVPVLVLRSTTERQEAVEAGTAQLVGTDPDRIVAKVEFLL